ncbi:MAG TPA: hypothetical protein VFA60_04300 [Terriglobales bacterium]|nr:hypothetical protein [Terriglobales bacterium]
MKLSSKGQVLRARRGPGLDEDVPTVAKMDEVFTFAGREHIAVTRRGLGVGNAL